MIHTTYEDDDGNQVTKLDAEGIDYLLRGLEQLRDSEPGTELVTPSIADDLSEAGFFVLLRAEDVPIERGG